ASCCRSLFLLTDTAPSEIYTLSLHDALPIFTGFRTGIIGEEPRLTDLGKTVSYAIRRCEFDNYLLRRSGAGLDLGRPIQSLEKRSEEHTSELQSRGHLVCRLLLEKKKISSTR